MMRAIAKLVMIAVVGLGLIFFTGTAFSAQVAGKTSTQTAPIQSNTQTAPLPSKTKTVTLPSTTREYQQVNKPPVKTLDIPDYDLAGELRIEGVRYQKYSNKNKTSVIIDFRVALMNKGKKNVRSNVPYRVRLINATNQTLCKEYMCDWNRNVSDIKHDYWTVERQRTTGFTLDLGGAPHTIKDLKMIVDIDPNNTFGEAQRFRGNNRCIATW